MDSPFGLLAELTYRCPLACAYCSNPLNMADYTDELTTAEWRRVLTEAAELGVLQCHLSGGEPLLRRDLVELVRGRERAGPLHQPGDQRARALAAAGRAAAGRRPRPRAGQHPGRRAGRVRPDRRARRRSSARSRPMARGQGAGLAAHRERRAAPAEHRPRSPTCSRWPRRWAPTGSSWPTPSTTAGPGATGTRCCRAGPSSRRPRSSCGRRASGCGTGWTSSTSSPTTTAATRSRAWAAGPSRQLTVTPNGDVLPCPAAQSLPLPRANVRDDCAGVDLGRQSPVMTAFRGTDWMPDPCRSCDRRELDFGGCRCQAFQLTGDAARTDPVCHLSPDHGLVADAVQAANARGTADRPAARPPPAPGLTTWMLSPGGGTSA